MKKLDHRWLGAKFGIVKVQTEFGRIKYYAGACEPGNSEEEDLKHIALWGSSVEPEDMIEFFTKEK